MKQKLLYAVFPISAVILFSACGRNDEYARNDHAVTAIPRETVSSNHNRTSRDAGDVIDDGMDIVSDIVDDGRKAAGDVNSAVDDIARKESNAETDKNDNYYADTDGRTTSQTIVR